MTRRSVGVGATVLLVLVSGCALQHEESPSPTQSMDAAPEAAAPEAAAPAPVESLESAEESPAPPTVAELERALATNNAKLRELGVSLPATARGGVAPTKPEPSRLSDGVGSKGGAGGKASPPPAKDRDVAEQPRPGPAKSTPVAPRTGQLDAGERCEQICDLAEISCGLGDQICELADRHTQEPEYLSACERAAGDCDAAKEACDACAE